MTKFQIAVIGIFIAFIVAGAIAFATFKGSQGTTLPSVTVWGTMPSALITSYIQQINQSRSTQLQVSYVHVDPAAFNSTLINALAAGGGPDVILVPADMLSRWSDKLVPIPYSTLPARDFKDTYVQGAELYLGSQGVNAVPFLIDPLVMYWNRPIFTAAGLATYPRYWDEFNSLAPKLTAKDSNGNIQKSAVPLGQFANVQHAREIFATLLLQLGNPVTTASQGRLSSALGNGGDYAGQSSTLQALSFFTQFANPTSSQYSWNRGLPDAQSFFLSGNSAVYFGFASEINALRAKNPNLDFDAAPLPQIRSSASRAAYGTIYGLSIVKSSHSPSTAYSVMQILADPSNLSTLVGLSYLPPARRDMIAAGTTEPYLSIFYDSALIARAWNDVDPAASSAIFRSMTEAVESGAKIPAEAVKDASDQYDLLLSSK